MAGALKQVDIVEETGNSPAHILPKAIRSALLGPRTFCKPSTVGRLSENSAGLLL